MARISDREKRLSGTGSDIPEWERSEVLLRDLGADERVIIRINESIDDRDVKGRVAKLRTFAQEHPLVVLGALSALLAGGGAVVARKVTKGKKTATKSRSTSKRTLIEPHPGDKRYVRRDAKGRIKESVDVGRSLSADRRRKSKTKAKSGSGDKGDR